MGYWWLKPDSFIINPGLNVQPFQEINHFLWDDSPNYLTSRNIGLREIKIEYDKNYIKIQNAIDGIKKVDQRHKKLEDEAEKLSIVRDNEVDENFSAYDIRMLKPFKNFEVKLQDELSDLEKKLPKTIKNQSDLEKIKIVGEKRIELASARLKTAVQAAKNSQFLLDNIPAFFSKSTAKKYNEISNERSLLYKKRYDLEKERGEARVIAIDTVSKDLAEIRNRVKWSDFVFFSVGISTTTTFGDLVANDRATKSIVSIQLLLCLFIVGGFLNSVIKTK